MDEKRRIIVFYRGYLPGKKYGGPVTSLHNFSLLLGDTYDIYIVCSNHDLHEKCPYEGIGRGWIKVENTQVNYISDKELNCKKFKQILEETSPDCIYVSSIFSARMTYPVLKLAKRKGIPVILATRGEVNCRALASKHIKKTFYLKILSMQSLLNNIYFQATSEEEENDISRTLNVPRDRVILLPNVPSLPLHKDKIQKQIGKLKLCYVGRIINNKNLQYVLKVLSKVKGNVDFDIYGPIENGDYWNDCQKLMAILPENIKASYRGNASKDELDRIYHEHDFLISPTKFENYGQSIVESMLHDTPVIISKGTTPWDDINKYKSGFAIPLENDDEFISVISNLCCMDTAKYIDIVSRLKCYTELKFNYEELENNYIKSFNMVMEKKF